MVLVILVGIVILFTICITALIEQKDVVEISYEHQNEVSEMLNDKE